MTDTKLNTSIFQGNEKPLMNYCGGPNERRMRLLEGTCQQEKDSFESAFALQLPFEDFLQFLFQSVAGDTADPSSPSSPSHGFHYSEADTSSSYIGEDYEDSDEDEQEIFQSNSFQISRGVIPKVSIRFATRTPSMSSYPDPEPERGESAVPELPTSRRPSPQSDTLAFYKNFSASYGRRRRSKTWLNPNQTPLSSAKGLSRSVPMKLNSLAKKKRQVQSLEPSPLPPVTYSSPQASVKGDAKSSTQGSEADPDPMQSLMETLENKTMSLFLNAATSPASAHKTSKKTVRVNPADISMPSRSDTKTNQVLQRRKTLC